MLFTVSCGFEKKKLNKDGDNISNKSHRNASWLHLISGLFLYLLRKHLLVFTCIFEVFIAFHHPHNSLVLSFAASLDAISVSVCCHGNATDIMGNLEAEW